MEERQKVHNYVAVVGGAQGVAYNVSTQYKEDGSGLLLDISPVSEVGKACRIVCALLISLLRLCFVVTV